MRKLIGLLRSLGVMLAVLPSVGVGLAVLAAGRGRRRAANAMIGVWIRLAPRVAGLRLAVEHGERIDESRPAVFLFNHESSADILILCMLLRRDFTGVAKQEIRRNWVFGPAFAFAGAVFIDRFDRPKAIAALQPAVDVLHGGISVGIAPEGTRSPDGQLGRFRKGAFRLALAARVPLVPIVIHHSRRVLPKREIAVHPATVRIEVLAPIPTEGWKLEELDERIAEVRQLYLERLGASGAEGSKPS